MSRFLIIGLGNIGSEYAHTRHNIGFDITDALVSKHSASFTTERLAELARFTYKGKEILVIKPATYMNLSGRAVKYWVDNQKLVLQQTLVVVDDIALPLSKLRLRPAGSDAGHNGLKSIQDALGTVSYPKLRYGIGNNFAKGKQVDYVLGKWDLAELPLVELKIGKSVEVIESFIFKGIERTMEEVNKKEFIL